MKTRLLLILPFLTLLYCLEAFFLNVQFKYTIPISSFSDEPNPVAPEETPAEVVINGGIYSKLKKIQEAIQYTTEEDIPSDGKLEKTLDKLGRSLLTSKILVFLVGFLALLSIATFISIYFNAWFYPFLGRVLFFISILISLQYVTISIGHLVYAPSLGYYSFLYNFSHFVLMIWGFRTLGKIKNYEDMQFYSLYIGSLNDDDNHTGKIQPRKSEDIVYSKNAFLNWILDSLPVRLVVKAVTNSTLRHFFYIIISGMIIGNVLYIPLFSLQKHYSSEFGILLFGMIIVLCMLYIRNYYSFLKEENVPLFKGIVASSVLLQFRFIHNLLYFFLSTAGVVLFIVALFLMLTFNTIILKNYNLIDRTLNL